jgi:hypothetical protein
MMTTQIISVTERIVHGGAQTVAYTTRSFDFRFLIGAACFALAISAAVFIGKLILAKLDRG